MHICLAIAFVSLVTDSCGSEAHFQKHYNTLRPNLKRTITTKSTGVRVGDSNGVVQEVVNNLTRSKRSLSKSTSTTEIVTASKKDSDSLYTNVPLSKKQEIFEEIDEPIKPHTPSNVYHYGDDTLINDNIRKASNIELDDYKQVEDVDNAVSDELNSILGDDTGLERSLNGEAKDYTKMPTMVPVIPTRSRSTVAVSPSSSESIGDDVELAIDENAERNKDVSTVSVTQGNDQPETQEHTNAQSVYEENKGVFGGIENNNNQQLQQQQQHTEFQNERELEKERQALAFQQLLDGSTNVVIKENNEKYEEDNQQPVTVSSKKGHEDLYHGANDQKNQHFPLAPSQGVTETVNDNLQGTWTVSMDTNRTNKENKSDGVSSSLATGSPNMSGSKTQIQENNLAINTKESSGNVASDKMDHKNNDKDEGIYIPTKNKSEKLKNTINTKNGYNSSSLHTKNNDSHFIHDVFKGIIDSDDDSGSGGRPAAQKPSSSFINDHPIAFKILMEYFQNETHLQEQLQNKLKGINVGGKTTKKSNGLHSHRHPLPMRKFISKLLKLAKKYETKIIENAHKGPKQLEEAVKSLKKHFKKKTSSKMMKQILHQVSGSRKDGVIPANNKIISVNKIKVTPVSMSQKDVKKMAHVTQTTMSPLEIDKALKAMENTINKMLLQRERPKQPLTQQITSNYLNPPSTLTANVLNQPTNQQTTSTVVNQPTNQQITSTVVNQLTNQQITSNLVNQPFNQQITTNLVKQPTIQQMTLNQLNQALNQNFTQMNNGLLYQKRLKNLERSLSQDFFRFWMYHFKSFEEMSIHPEQLRSGIASLGSTARLGRVVRKAIQGKTINLLIVGGSISAGGGLERDRHDVHGIYFKALEEWWKNVVEPITGAHLQMDVVAIGGTDSEYFSYCIKNYIHQQPDLVLWELAANDYRRYLGRNMDPAKPLEQLTRVLLTLPSHPAIIFVNFFRGDYYKTTLGQNCPDSEDEGGRLVAEYYKITSLSWRNVICSQMKQEPLFASLAFKREYSPLTLKTLFSSDGYHPSLLGHAQCASLLISYIRSVFEEVVSQEVAKSTAGSSYNDMNVNTNEHLVLPRPLYDDPPNPDPLCWTLLTPDYNLNIPNRLPNMKIVQASGFVLTNVSHWPVRTDRLRCLKSLYPGASLVVSFFAPTHINDVTKPIREMVMISHNSFTGSANVWLDNNAATPMFLNEPSGQRRTQTHVVSRDLSPGGHVMTISTVQPGFCVSGLAIL